MVEILARSAVVSRPGLGHDTERAADKVQKRTANTARAVSTRRHAAAALEVDSQLQQHDLDLPDLNLERNRNTKGQRAPAYIRRAVKQTTKKINRCYKQARAQHPGLTGELVTQFWIQPNGKVRDVLVIQSTVTEAMSRCARRVIQKTKFKAHGSSEPIEVVAPWKFVAR